MHTNIECIQEIVDAKYDKETPALVNSVANVHLIKPDEEILDAYNIIKNNRGGNNKKYYKITGRTLKKMLMKCGTKKGDEICDYYLKVEQLAIFMKEYIIALHSFILQNELNNQKLIIDNTKNELNNQKLLKEKAHKQLIEKELMIATQQQKLIEKDNRSELLKSFVDHIQTKEENSYFYIITSKQYAKKIISN